MNLDSLENLQSSPDPRVRLRAVQRLEALERRAARAGDIPLMREIWRRVRVDQGEPEQAPSEAPPVARHTARTPRRARAATAAKPVAEPPGPPAEPPRRRPEAVPVTLSDATAFATTGLTPRQFRAAVRELGVPHVRIGRRTVCRVDAWLAAVDRLAGVPTSIPAWDEAAIVAAARGDK